ncbi:hypothetical protein JCM11641_003157 [Rhodosporidiobolus odoratus]
MGQTASAPSTPFLSTPSLRRTKHKKGDDLVTACLTAPPVPTSAWLPRRGKKQHKRVQRAEAQQFLAEAARNQKEVARLLAVAQLEGRACIPRLVVNEEEDDALEGLAIRVAGRKFSRDEPVLPPLDLHETLEALHEQFKHAAIAHSRSPSAASTSLSRSESAPSRAPTYGDSRSLSLPPLPTSAFSPTASSRSISPLPSPHSHWSESSAGPSPLPPFESFRNSLTVSQLHRLSTGLAPTSSASHSPVNALHAPSPEQAARGSKRGKLAGMLSRKGTNCGGSTKKRPTIVVVEAHRIGSGRYSVLKDAAEAAVTTRRLSEAEKKVVHAAHAGLTAKALQARKPSVASIDVWDSQIPLPGRPAAPLPSPMVALSPRFSTTPAAPANIYLNSPEDVRADSRNLNRTSWIMLDGASAPTNRPPSPDLSGYIAASPELTCAPQDREIFVAIDGSPQPSPATSPAPRRVSSRAPFCHPSSYHSRFAHVLSITTVTNGRRASTSTILTLSRQLPSSRRRTSVHTSPVSAGDIVIPPTGRGRRRSSYRISIADIDEEASSVSSMPRRRASCVSLATTSNSADQAVVSRAVAVNRRCRLGSVAETTLSSGSHLLPSTPSSDFPLPFTRPQTLYSQHSGLSFPRSVHDDPESPLPSPEGPPMPVSPAGNSVFNGYSMAKAATRRCSFANSVSPETVDAFPPPPSLPFPSPAVPPAPLDLAANLRRSLDAGLALSSPTTLNASTPSTASFTSSLTSDTSVELISLPGNIALGVDFTEAALGGNTYYKNKATSSPTPSSGSLATFVLDDLLNDLEATGGAWEGPSVTPIPFISTSEAPPRPKGRLSLEQAELVPSLLLAPPLPVVAPRSPPHFLSSFSFNPPFTPGKHKLAIQTSPATHPLNDGIFDSPYLLPRTPEGAHRFPASPSPRPSPLDGTSPNMQATWTTLPSRTRASAGDTLLFSVTALAPLEARRGTFPEWLPPSQRDKERSLFDALLARSAVEEAEVEVEVEALPAGREKRLSSADKRGFSKREVSDWIVQARRESEVAQSAAGDDA